MKYESLFTVRRGISLAEVLVSSMLVGIVLVGALKVVGGAVQTRRINSARLDGPQLALELWSEIMSKPYDDPELPGGALGLESGEAAPRANFDDLDDYAGWSQSPPVDVAGTAMTAYNGWTREVFVSWTDPSQGDNTSASETGLKRFLVRVTAPDGTAYDRQGLRFIAGALEQPPAVDATVVTQVTSQLQLGSQTTSQTSTTNMINHADTP